MPLTTLLALPYPEMVWAAQLAFTGVAVMVAGVFTLRLTGDAEQVKAVERMVQVAPVTGVVDALTLFAPTTLPLLLAASVKESTACLTSIDLSGVEVVTPPLLSVTTALMA